MQDFEQLGVFYLGKRKPAHDATAEPQLALYDSRDLVTHALCVGMTGSGKTGLGISLIEEAAIDGVPVLAIDPKGDLADLLLTFPQLRPEDFAPWVNPDDAQRAGQSVADFAAAEAKKWHDGLAQWGEDGDRIARLRSAADFTIYTPGSNMGVPVSVLGSFAPPPVQDAELLAEHAQSSVSGLLALAGIDADSLTSPAHILLTNILVAAWQAGESVSLPVLIQRVQTPPMKTVGVLAVDDFMPQKERFGVAMALNALLAAPGFAVWTQGDPLDIGALLRTHEGKPRVSIFSIAHLDDSQRMFFVTQLLSAVVAWMRAQSGTSSLRALLYMDEIFGFFPPIASPPSKLPLLTLLKQARAFGLGIMLCTQNPADLDYKGLGNIGTWWLGRLQTQRDKDRVLDGLESASGAGLDRGEVDTLLSNIPGRTFLMRNVHEQELSMLQTRWAMSYLRGPLGRDEIHKLMEGKSRAETPPMTGQMTGQTDPISAPSVSAAPASSAAQMSTPMAPQGIPQFFAPASAGGTLAPSIYAALSLRLSNARLGVDSTQKIQVATPMTDGPVSVDWDNARLIQLTPAQLAPAAPAGVNFAPLPGSISKSDAGKWTTALKNWASASQGVELYQAGGLTSKPGESQRDFLARVDLATREQRDEQLDKLREKYQSKRATLEDKVERAKATIGRETSQAAGAGLDSVLSIGATIAGALLGHGYRRSAGSAMRSAGHAIQQGTDIKRAHDTYNQAVQELSDFDAQFQQEALKVKTPQLEDIKTVTLKPGKDDVQVDLLALVWMPQS